ncbi:MAG: hypothetical protein HY207_11510 [Nitrospirae bacterium]|nr:hypothetical protein [Nitrospirota bacterium]
MRMRFYLIVILVLASAAMLVDAVLGKLYIRYMILFSGAVFLWGMAVGQRSEQAWIRRRDRLARRGTGAAPRRARMTEEVTK